MSDEDEAYRRSVEALRSRDENVVRVSLDGWASVTGVDLVQFRDQATRESVTYTQRDRPTLARTFAALAEMANAELEGRVLAGDRPAVYSVRVRLARDRLGSLRQSRTTTCWHE